MYPLHTQHQISDFIDFFILIVNKPHVYFPKYNFLYRDYETFDSLIKRYKWDCEKKNIENILVKHKCNNTLNELAAKLTPLCVILYLLFSEYFSKVK